MINHLISKFKTRRKMNPDEAPPPPPLPSAETKTSDQKNLYDVVAVEGQPLSIGSVRPLVPSLPSAEYDAYRQPPSLNDVRGPQGSQTGPSNPGFDPEAVPGMSMTASNFKRMGPNAFKKDDSYGS
ncbi:hypothetical protein HanPSC8_Chr09g0375711 [Helianthus annuus]|nr:hypothetical protein HanPSC8_Chr09g0375711 [Helianthus annuus]